MSKKWAPFWLLLFVYSIEAQQNSSSSSQLTPTLIANTNSTAWLHVRFANQSHKIMRLEREHQKPQKPAGYAIEVSPPANNFQYLPAPRLIKLPETPTQQNNRSTRTANVNFDDSPPEVPESQDESSLFVSNACERDFMLVEVKSSRPFYGLIHTLDHRRKLICTTEGDGGSHYKLTISHALNPHDPQHCGVARLMRQDQKEQRDILSVILAIRSNRNIELSEDKFFALNCTNRCRRPDCSSGQLAIGRLVGELQARNSNGWRSLERETSQTTELHSNQLLKQQDNCALWRPPWLVAALVCLSIVLIGMLVSNCIICMALRASERRAAEESAQEATAESERRRTSRNAPATRRNQQINYENEPIEPTTAYEQQRYEYSSRPSRSHHQSSGKSRVAKSYR